MIKPESDALFLHKFCGRRNLPYSDEEKKIAIELLHMGYSKSKISFSMRFTTNLCFFGIQDSQRIKNFINKHRKEYNKYMRQAKLRKDTCDIVKLMSPETRKLYAKLVRGDSDEEILRG